MIAATVLAFVLGLAAFNLGVQKQFFPPSNRPELLVDLWLPQGASLKATAREVERVEALLADPRSRERIDNVASYIGNGAPRFYLPLDQQLFNDNFGQLVIVTRGFAEREAVKAHLAAAFAAPDGSWSHLRTRVQRLETGPPVQTGLPDLMSSEEADRAAKNDPQVAAVMRAIRNGQPPAKHSSSAPPEDQKRLLNIIQELNKSDPGRSPG